MAREVVKLRLVLVLGAIVGEDVQVEPVGRIHLREELFEHTSHNEKPVSAPLDLFPLPVGGEIFLAQADLERVKVRPKHIDEGFWLVPARVHVEDKLHH